MRKEKVFSNFSNALVKVASTIEVPSREKICRTFYQVVGHLKYVTEHPELFPDGPTDGFYIRE